ncbi:MAG: hypothetical protein HRT45_08585 [Bdellovibrionales bacterium]|nr:hypothetical protein [Bdellovibrionales bacterium]
MEVEHPSDQSMLQNDAAEPIADPYKLQSNLKSEGIEGTGQDGKTKSSLRIKYEAEKRSLEKQLGSLEEIRSRLGLSQRKMAQLLMVDPSAWTRWIKDPDKVPPHVYRSLQWYLELTEKQPQWSPENSFGPLTQKLNQKIDEAFSGDSSRLHQELASLRHEHEMKSRQIAALQESLDEQSQSFAEKVDNKDTALAIWKLFILLNSIILFFWLVWNVL